MIQSFYFEDFKSFQKTELPLEAFTTIIGTNASGKSNAIEGMKILSELSTGKDISLVLDGSKNSDGGIRGGSKGCCRTGTSSFTLGCAVFFNKEYNLDYKITIAVDNHIYVEEESLYKSYADRDPEKIFMTKPVWGESGDIRVSYRNGKRGTDPDLTCIRSSSIIAQLKTKMPTEDRVLKDNIRCIDLILSNLKNVLFLDPVPSEMRDYVRSTDTDLKVNCENISPVLKKLCSNPADKETLLTIISNLPENEIQDIEFITTQLGDVIFTLRENFGYSSEAIDAKRLSDGTLRCIAIVTALVTEPENSVIVIEEIDNGIHPGRAQKLIGYLAEIGKRRKISIIITTHNATLLNSFSKSNLHGVSVAYRDKSDGDSRFCRLIDIEKMPELFAKGGLGDAFVNDPLINAIKDTDSAQADYSWMEELK